MKFTLDRAKLNLKDFIDDNERCNYIERQDAK